MLWPVADGACVSNRTLVVEVSDRFVEVRKSFSFWLAMVELAMGVFAIAVAVPIDATNLGKWFMPLVACPTIWAQSLRKSPAEEL